MKNLHHYFVWLIAIVTLTCLLYINMDIHTKPMKIYRTLDPRQYFKENLLDPQQDSLEMLTSTPEVKTSVRLLCWVLTGPAHHRSKCKAIKETWGKRCDKLIFFSTKNDPKLGAIRLNVTEGKGYTWAKTRLAYKYIYDHYLYEYDWFLKADDDTYVIVENLRYLLTLYDPEFPIALGDSCRRYKFPYLAGGSGFVLSRGAVITYAEKAYNNHLICFGQLKGFAEDMKLGRCMANVGTMIGDSRDEYGHGRFHLKKIEAHIEGTVKRYPIPSRYNYGKGIESISTTSISFHNMKSHSEILALDFLIYRLQVYGFEKETMWRGPPPLPPDLNAVPKQILKIYGHNKKTNKQFHLPPPKLQNKRKRKIGKKWMALGPLWWFQ